MNRRRFSPIFSVILGVTLLLLVVVTTNSNLGNVSLAQTGIESTPIPSTTPISSGYGSVQLEGQPSDNLFSQANFSSSHVSNIESYNANDNIMTIYNEHRFVGNFAGFTWTFGVIDGELLGIPSFSSTGAANCNWVPSRRRVECTGDLESFTLSYQVKPIVQNSSIIIPIGFTWIGTRADITYDLFYPESLTFIISTNPPTQEEIGHLFWTQANSSGISSQVTFFVGIPVGTDDPLFPQQWGLHKIEIVGGWSQSQDSSNITIAVIDTGTDYTHVDLGGGKTLTNNDRDYVNNDNDAMDDQGHGTHVAGIAAANTNNGQGIAGVCPQCRILPLKVLDSAGTGDFADVATAIQYAADQGVEVINMSLGGDSCTTALANAINYAYERNVTIVAASGNSCPVKVAFGLETFAVSYPAQFNRVIAVGATDSADNLANFSNYGPTLDVTAPGVGILSTYLEGSYQRLDGTSMASPMVAGLAGLILSKNPSLTPAQVQKIIETSADNLGSPGWDAQTGWGRINANRALQTIVGNIAPTSTAVCLNPANVEVTASTKEENLVTLYTQLRDEVLMSTDLGQSYVNLFYEYGPELAGILLTNSNLRTRTAQFLDHASEEFGSLLPNSNAEITLTQELYNEANVLVQDLAAAGDKDFRSKMTQTWDKLALDEHIGEKTTDIWDQMNRKIIYLPIIIK